MSIQEQLITILQSKHIGVGAIPNVAAAIAADARFNIWILEHAKKQASEGQMIELLDRYEKLHSRCSTIVKNFREHHNVSEMMADVDALTKELTEAAKMP